MNIVVIVSDSFRYDHIGCYGNSWIRTPNLDKFAQNSIIFDRAYLSSFATIPARLDILTGRYSFTYTIWGPLGKEEVVLSEILNKGDYVTQAMIDTPHIPGQHNYQRGFKGWKWIRGQEGDEYITDDIEIKFPCSPDKLRAPDQIVQYLRNVSIRRYEEDYFPAQTMREANRWLEKNYKHNKFFLYIDTFDPHEPWDPPEWYVNMYDPHYKGENVFSPRYWYCDYLTPQELKHCRALYAGEISLVDNWIGKLFGKMENLGLWENTAIFFMSDHGFLHGEHGVIGKAIFNPPRAKGKEDAFSYVPLYEEIAHIPLMAHIPGIKKKRHCKGLVQLCDLAPTILELAGIKVPSTVQGKSLLPLLRGEIKNLRKLAVSSPSIIFGGKANAKTTITTEDGWSLLLAAKNESIEDRYTSQVDNQPKRLASIGKYHGKYQNELYYLPKDPRQEKNLFIQNKDIAEKIHRNYIKFLHKVATKEDIIHYWERL
jgi:arylsulfatase A-like enzyme